MNRLSTRLALCVALLLGFAANARATFWAKNYVVFSTSSVNEGLTYSPGLTMTGDGLLDDGTGAKELWIQMATINFHEDTGCPAEASHSLLVKGVFENDAAFPNRAYSRYSADGKHWSTWQHILSVEISTAARRETSRYFDGAVSVPDAQRVRLQEHRARWKKENPAAKDSELYAWLMKHHAKTLAEDIPFLAFLQFRLEGARNAGKPSLVTRLLLNVQGEDERTLKPEKLTAH